MIRLHVGPSICLFSPSYLFTFLDSTTHRDMTLKLREFWLSKRADPLTPTPGEEDTHEASGRHVTLSFRQFVNMITRCPAEFPGRQDGGGFREYI